MYRKFALITLLPALAALTWLICNIFEPQFCMNSKLVFAILERHSDSKVPTAHFLWAGIPVSVKDIPTLQRSVLKDLDQDLVELQAFIERLNQDKPFGLGTLPPFAVDIKAFPDQDETSILAFENGILKASWTGLGDTTKRRRVLIAQLVWHFLGAKNSSSIEQKTLSRHLEHVLWGREYSELLHIDRQIKMNFDFVAENLESVLNAASDDLAPGDRIDWLKEVLVEFEKIKSSTKEPATWRESREAINERLKSWSPFFIKKFGRDSWLELSLNRIRILDHQAMIRGLVVMLGNNEESETWDRGVRLLKIKDLESALLNSELPRLVIVANRELKAGELIKLPHIFERVLLIDTGKTATSKTEAKPIGKFDWYFQSDVLDFARSNPDVQFFEVYTPALRLALKTGISPTVSLGKSWFATIKGLRLTSGIAIPMDVKNVFHWKSPLTPVEFYRIN